MSRITRVFLAGCFALLPLAVTAAAVVWLVSFLADFVGPSSWIGRQLTALGMGVSATSATPYVLGVLVIVFAILLLGLLVESRLGPWFSAGFDSLITRVPLIGSIYDISKRFTSIVDGKEGGNIKSMSPVWCFFGGEPGAAVLALMPSSLPVRIGTESYLGILVPSAPVPIGGALIYVPASWVKPAEGGVEHLMSVYVSMGVTPPKE